MSEHAAPDEAELRRAFRNMDASVLERAIAASDKGRLPYSIESVVGNLDHLRKFVSHGSPETGTLRGRRRISAWRRLGSLLDGGIPESTPDGQENASLLALVDSCVQKRTYGGLSYPLAEGEAGWLGFVRSLMISGSGNPKNATKAVDTLNRFARNPVKEDDPGEKGSKRIRELNGRVVATICSKECIPLARGEAKVLAGILSKKKVAWTGDAIVSSIRSLKEDQIREFAIRQRVTNLMFLDFGISEETSMDVAIAVARSIRTGPEADDDALRLLIAPFRETLETRVKVRTARSDFLAMKAKSRNGFFAGQSEEPEVRALVDACRPKAALSRMRARRTEIVRTRVKDALGVGEHITWRLSPADDDRRLIAVAAGLVPDIASDLRGACGVVSSAFGFDASGKRMFAKTLVGNEAAARSERTARDAETRRLESSWIQADEAAGILGATIEEFTSWVAEGRIPVRGHRTHLRAGRLHQATLHDRAVVAGFADAVPSWRAQRPNVPASSELLEPSADDLRKAVFDEAARVRRSLVVGFMKSAKLAKAAWDGRRMSVELDIPIGPGVAWKPRLLLDPPASLEAAIDPGTAASDATTRKAVSDELSACVSDAKGSAMETLSEIVSVWSSRTEAVATGFGEKDRTEFQGRIVAEIRRVFVRDSTHAASDALASLLTRRLDQVLADCVNIQTRRRRIEGLPAASGLADYAAMFPEARAKRRRLVLLLGPTNSGKTHRAMDMLCAAASGAYLAPLRLMALEGSERMNGDRGVPTDMVTGEEIVRVEGARHVSATIEMADTFRPIEVAVVDEIQMIENRERGWAWSQAVVGIPADVVVMTGSVDALPYITRIARMTGDEIEVEMFERRTPLEALSVPVGLDKVRDGDAVVAFSRSEVLRMRDELQDRGIEAAAIYGALGPEVRKGQAARFRSGAAKVLVATDAIGMGLNLPIQRILLSSLSKFDGTSVRPLTDSEIRQICGRAGRFGMSEKGFAGTFPGEDPKRIADAIASVSRPPQDDRIPVMPPWSAVQAVSEALGTDDLREILEHVTKHILRNSDVLRAPDMTDCMVVCSATARSGLPLRIRFSYLGCPVDTRDEHAVERLGRWAFAHGKGDVVDVPVDAPHGAPHDETGLARCERLAKTLTAYMWMSMRYPGSYTGHEQAAALREKVNGFIETALRRKSLARSCRKCGRKIPARSRIPVCDSCDRQTRDEW